MKHLVVFYSYSKKTKIAAGIIANNLKAELREIVEVKKRNKFFVYFTGGFQAVNERCSIIKEMNFSTEGFDTITLCTPVWGSKQAPAMNSFLSKADIKDKKINLFITLGGPAPEKALECFKRKVESYGGKVNKKVFMSTGMLKNEEIETLAKKLVEKLK
jgi:flavodoxin